MIGGSLYFDFVINDDVTVTLLEWACLKKSHESTYVINTNVHITDITHVHKFDNGLFCEAPTPTTT